MLSTIFKELQAKDPKTQILASKALGKVVIKYFRTKSTKKGFTSTNIVDEIHKGFQEMLKDSKEENRIGVMYGLQQLIPIDYPDPKKMYHFSNYLRNTLTLTGKWPTCELVTRTVGFLAKQSMRSLKTISVEWIDFEIKRALEWLQEKDLNPHRGFVASLVLMEFAQNAETLFFVYYHDLIHF
jgi:hypothetical protein